MFLCVALTLKHTHIEDARIFFSTIFRNIIPAQESKITIEGLGVPLVYAIARVT